MNVLEDCMKKLGKKMKKWKINGKEIKCWWSNGPLS